MESEQTMALVEQQNVEEQQQEKEKVKEDGREVKVSVFEMKRNAINESVAKLNELASALTDVCKKCVEVAHSLQTLERTTIPEVIGNSTRIRVPKRPVFDRTGCLIESLNTFNEIFTAYCDRIKRETIDEFDNFIMQVVCPNPEELLGIYEHNKVIIEEFRSGCYSLMNHFYVLGAELLEKFLICGECDTPIGFTHPLGCSVRCERERTFRWRKLKRDDKFITLDMRFSFDELLDSRRRSMLVKLINGSIAKQIHIGNRGKTSLPLNAKTSWPNRWSRGAKNPRCKSRGNRTLPVHAVHPPIFNPSAWTPKAAETRPSFDVTSFAYCPCE